MSHFMCKHFSDDFSVLLTAEYNAADAELEFSDIINKTSTNLAVTYGFLMHCGAQTQVSNHVMIEWSNTSPSTDGVYLNSCKHFFLLIKLIVGFCVHYYLLHCK